MKVLLSLDRMSKESHQYLDSLSMFHPITKWNTSLCVADVIPETRRKAFKLAQTERKTLIFRRSTG